jgi:CBS domain-containing protein
MISDRDLRGVGGSEQERAVTEIMTSDVATIDPETEVEEIIDLILDLKIGALPVVDEETKELMGIVSYVDVLRALKGRE